MSSPQITADQILSHRAGRKMAGLTGCQDGSDMPLGSLSGISWRPADPLNPSCFCVDCRSSWDKEGKIDADLVNGGHKMACYVYESLLPKEHSYRDYRPAPILIPPRTETYTSLHAPRHRDLMNEMPDQRLKGDLNELLIELQFRSQDHKTEEKIKAIEHLLTLLNDSEGTGTPEDSPLESWVEVCEVLQKRLNLKHAVISLREITSEADLDKILCAKEAVIQSCFSKAFSYRLDGPITYRSVICVFDKMLEEINGDTNHVFLEQIQVISPTEEGKPHTILLLTGS